MKTEFWHQRWREGRIGFHQKAYNAQLINHWQGLSLGGGLDMGLKNGGTVFVPMAGKSLDMIWLAEQGHKVLGVELSRVAAEAFFAENKLEAEQDQRANFEIFRSGKIELWCGDFFALTPEHLASVDAVYDRAALIALPPGMRAKYAAHMAACLPARTQTMLVTLEYPQSEMEGPPFSVSEAEVRDLYAAEYDIERVGCISIGAEGRPPAGRDLSEMFEKTWYLKPKTAV